MTDTSGLHKLGAATQEHPPSCAAATTLQATASNSGRRQDGIRSARAARALVELNVFATVTDATTALNRNGEIGQRLLMLPPALAAAAGWLLPRHHAAASLDPEMHLLYAEPFRLNHACVDSAVASAQSGVLVSDGYESLAPKGGNARSRNR